MVANEGISSLHLALLKLKIINALSLSTVILPSRRCTPTAGNLFSKHLHKRPPCIFSTISSSRARSSPHASHIRSTGTAANPAVSSLTEEYKISMTSSTQPWRRPQSSHKAKPSRAQNLDPTVSEAKTGDIVPGSPTAEETHSTRRRSSPFSSLSCRPPIQPNRAAPSPSTIRCSTTPTTS